MMRRCIFMTIQLHLNPGVDPARKFRGADFGNIWQSISVGSQVSFRIVQNHGEKSYFRRI